MLTYPCPALQEVAAVSYLLADHFVLDLGQLLAFAEDGLGIAGRECQCPILSLPRGREGGENGVRQKASQQKSLGKGADPPPFSFLLKK